MTRVRLAVLIIYLCTDTLVFLLSPLFFTPIFNFHELLRRLNPLNYTISTGIIDLVLLAFLRVFLLAGAAILHQAKIFSAGQKCQTAIVFMSIFLYAFATGKLLAISEEDQQAAMWLLVSWNLAASILHPIIWIVTIKIPNKQNDYNQLTEETDESNVENGVEEDSEEKLSALWISKVLAKYVIRHWHFLFPAIFCLCIYAITRVFIPDYIGRVIHAVSESGDMHSVITSVIWLSLLAFTSTLFGGFRGCLFQSIAGFISRDIRRDLFRSLVRQDIAFYDNTKTGDLVSRLSSDTATVISSLTTNMNVCSRNGIMIVGSLIVMLGISWRLTVTCFVTAPAFAILNKYFGEYFDKLAEKTQTALADTNKKAEEVLAQMRTVRSFANEENEAIKYENALEETVKFNNKKAVAYLFNVWVVEVCQHFSLIVVLLYGGYLVIQKEVTAGQLVTFFLYQMNLAEYVYWFGACFTETMASIGASRKIMKLMIRKPAFNQTAGELISDVNGQVQLEGVHFTYPSRKQNPVLDNVSLEINKGETVALVGPSGGGKSSIVSLIERFYEPLLGCIYLDGTPISQFEHRYYHRKVCLVSQEPQLFSGTIKENISYGLDECSEEQVIAAAETANAHDFIMKLEKKYETECGERGVQLSGGQKQRIAIARAVVRNPAVLILDEATSALDAESEAIVQEAMNKCAKDRTVIVIAHRLSTIKNAQRIAVIEKGRIVQIGNHETLMADSNGLYYSLVAKQLSSIN